MRKVVEKAGGIKEERYYLGNYEVYRKFVGVTLETERTTAALTDDKRKIATIDKLTVENSSLINLPLAVIRYQFDNHLGSASLELDASAQIISYEEYHPFGTTSYRSGKSETEVSLKRYKYVGKERDEETGLYYYGFRYYAPWIARFINVDPLQHEYPHYTPFQYAGNKPVTFIDLDGLEEASTAYDDAFPANPKHGQVQVLKRENGNSYYVYDEAQADWVPGGMSDINLEAVTVSTKATFKNRLKSFGKGLLIGAAVGAAIVLTIATGGAALAAIAPAAAAFLSSTAIVTTAGVLGGGLFAYSTVQSIRGRDFLNNEISSEEAAYNLGFGVGSIVGGALSKSVTGIASRYFAKFAKPKVAVSSAEASSVGQSAAVGEATKGSTQLTTRFVSTADGIVDVSPTLNRISSGVKFPHRNDGSIFKNLEGLLPNKPAGYYNEFVHPIPGMKGPGPMRIVTGQGGEMWFTPNHYKTFIPIR